MSGLTLQQERFVSNYAILGVAEAAARQAGYSASYARKSAHLLMRRPEIQAAIAEIRGELRATTKLTTERLMDKLEIALAQATKAKQFGPAAKILELQGKLHGLLVDRLAIEPVSLDLHDAIVRAQTTMPLTRDAPFKLVTGPDGVAEVDPLS